MIVVVRREVMVVMRGVVVVVMEDMDVKKGDITKEVVDVKKVVTTKAVVGVITKNVLNTNKEVAVKNTTKVVVVVVVVVVDMVTMTMMKISKVPQSMRVNMRAAVGIRICSRVS
jgi:hypothetical protein